jgi:hypothetical protein
MIRPEDVPTSYTSRPTLSDLIARLAALPRPDAIESGDVEPLPERIGEVSRPNSQEFC